MNVQRRLNKLYNINVIEYEQYPLHRFVILHILHQNEGNSIGVMSHDRMFKGNGQLRFKNFSY